MIALPDEWVRFVHAAKWGAVAVLFVAGSEVIWLTSSLRAWIWYHAFAVPIFFALMMLVQQALVAYFGRPPNLSTEVEAPPRSLEDRSTELAFVSHVRAAGTSLSYGKVALSQAQRIVSAIREEEIARQGPDRRKAAVPCFQVLFEDASGVAVYRHGDDTAGIRWYYLDAPRRAEFLGSGVHFAAASVPFDLISPIIAAAWGDDWDGVMELLRPYSPVDLVANQADARL